jgi:FlaA1/EpsC-like NDP-sugar epimerase
MNYSDFFEDKVILVIGGTGSIGAEIVSQILKYNPKTIRILSNSENELWETEVRFKNPNDKLRFLLGDIRDFERVKRAVEGTDYVFNAGAIKHVSFSEYNPMEAINVNIHGLDNIIEASLKAGVKKLIHMSTDKAVNPTTVMGATKMLGERLCIARELAKGTHSTIISCVRFGNVLGSRGSIIPLFKKQLIDGDVITLTDEKMVRFFLSLSQAVELVLKAAVQAQGGEIFVLKMPTIFIKDLIEIIIEDHCPIIGKSPEDIKIEIIGPHPGEKIHEMLISPHEFTLCYETEDMYIVLPSTFFGQDKFTKQIKVSGTKVRIDESFQYSTENSTPLNKEQIRKIIKENKLI